MFAPNAIIENLLQRKKAQAAMTLDALFATDAIQLESIEISSILHYFRLCGIGIGESIVRRGLFDLAQLRLLDTFKILTRGKGRPMWNYAPKSMAKMGKILGVQFHRDENHDAIPFSAFTTVKSYRSAKHYSHIARLGTSTPSRKKLGARLGVGGRSTYNYELGKNILVKARFETISLTKADIANAPETRPNANTFLTVEFVRKLTDAEMLEKYGELDQVMKRFFDEEIEDTKKMPYTKFILERELERGNRVYLTKQLTNEYSIAS